MAKSFNLPRPEDIWKKKETASEGDYYHYIDSQGGNAKLRKSRADSYSLGQFNEDVEDAINDIRFLISLNYDISPEDVGIKVSHSHDADNYGGGLIVTAYVGPLIVYEGEIEPGGYGTHRGSRLPGDRRRPLSTIRTPYRPGVIPDEEEEEAPSPRRPRRPRVVEEEPIVLDIAEDDYVPTVDEADYDLESALQEAAEELAEADVLPFELVGHGMEEDLEDDEDLRRRIIEQQYAELEQALADNDMQLRLRRLRKLKEQELNGEELSRRLKRRFGRLYNRFVD